MVKYILIYLAFLGGVFILEGERNDLPLKTLGGSVVPGLLERGKSGSRRF